jgi:hypothetical protein
MIEKKDPQSETFLSLLREENISRRILTVRGHSVILDEEVVTKCDHLSRLKFSPVLPFAYTRHGRNHLQNVAGYPWSEIITD